MRYIQHEHRQELALEAVVEFHIPRHIAKGDEEPEQADPLTCPVRAYGRKWDDAPADKRRKDMEERSVTKV